MLRRENLQLKLNILRINIFSGNLLLSRRTSLKSLHRVCVYVLISVCVVAMVVAMKILNRSSLSVYAYICICVSV